MASSPTPIRTTAPGSLMLMGEHAVLHGHHALCAAVEDTIQVTIQDGEPGRYAIHSALGTVSGFLKQIRKEHDLRFVLDALEASGIRKGFQMQIESQINPTIGFGSSAAVTTASVAAFRAWNGQVFDRSAIFRESLEVIRRVQGRGSGADVAASTYGGIVLYRADPLLIEPIHRSLPLAAVYCGYKTPTPEVIERIEQTRKQFPELHAHAYAGMNQTVLEAAKAIRGGDLRKVGALFSYHQGLQDAIGTNDSTLSHLLYTLRQNPKVTGSKISGSGLGDCVIALGDPGASVEDFPSREAALDLDGVTLDLEPV